MTNHQCVERINRYWNDRGFPGVWAWVVTDAHGKQTIGSRLFNGLPSENVVAQRAA